MLATVLAQPLVTPAARTAAWLQIVDLLAQGRAGTDQARIMRASAALRRLRADVPAPTRAAAARAIAGRRTPAALVALFAEDSASIAAPVIARAALPDQDWLRLLPSMPPAARGLLRHRRDLSQPVENALASFGSTDFVIGGPAREFHAAEEIVDEVEFQAFVADEEPEPEAEAVPFAGIEEIAEAIETVVPPPPPAAPSFDAAGAEAAILGGESQIRTLMARIEAYRQRNASARPDAPVQPGEPAAESFSFETGADGVIIWLEGAPRGPLIGQSIAQPAESGDHGVDGQAAGAYRRRSPFRSARLSIGGFGPASGDWRISAVPFFDPAGGRFLGYRGSARRPRPDEVARGDMAARGGLFGSGLQPDSLRQLVHELRTPINAIQGFAEMIEGQLLGPAATSYRVRASDIRAQAARLLDAVEDLDMAARVEGKRLDPGKGPVDGVALLERLKGDYAASLRDRSAEIELDVDPATPLIGVEPAMVERMAERLLAAALGLAGPGERIRLCLAPADDRRVMLAVSRPRALDGHEERELLDPGYSPEGDWPDAPALGLGFALRLVRNVAGAARGRLDISDAQFILLLPADGGSAITGEHRG